MLDASQPLEERLESLRLVLEWGRAGWQDGALEVAPWLPYDVPEELLEPFLERAPPPEGPLHEARFRPFPTRDQVLVALWRSHVTPQALRERVLRELHALPDLHDAVRAALPAIMRAA